MSKRERNFWYGLCITLYLFSLLGIVATRDWSFAVGGILMACTMAINEWQYEREKGGENDADSQGRS